MREYYARILLSENLQSLASTSAEMLFSQAVRCIEAFEYDEAEARLLQALQAKPADKAALDLLFSLYFTTGRPGLALASREAAFRHYPGNPGILNDIASCHYVMGEFDKAMEFYERSAEMQPDNMEVLSNIVIAREGDVGEPYISRLQALYRSGNSADGERMLVCFALAKVEERKGNINTAFRYYDEANRIAFALAEYDEKRWFEFFDAVEAVFTPELLSRFAAAGNQEAAPIFVFGMGRSGTSLVEQVLSAHPQVHGAGEADIIPYMAEKQVAQLTGQIYPHAVTHLRSQHFAELADHFLRRVRAYYPSAKPRIAVKTLNNFFHAGFISLLFPGARLIHCRREPMDNCWSLYKARFTGYHPYCYDQAALGRYYRRYQRLMEHWQRVMPGRICNVQYEQLVRQPEETIAGLLDYCGLPRAEECLEFYRHRRPIMTSSARQVQRPLYTTSIESWRQVADFLAPLKQALEGE